MGRNGPIIWARHGPELWFVSKERGLAWPIESGTDKGFLQAN